MFEGLQKTPPVTKATEVADAETMWPAEPKLALCGKFATWLWGQALWALGSWPQGSEVGH